MHARPLFLVDRPTARMSYAIRPVTYPPLLRLGMWLVHRRGTVHRVWTLLVTFGPT